MSYIKCCMVALAAAVGSQFAFGVATKSDAVAMSSDVVNKSQVMGKWKWVNSGKDYDVFMQFATDNVMKRISMRPGNRDVDDFKWSLAGFIIRYTRPAADEPMVHEMHIVQCDSSTMILREYVNGKKIDMWLERVK